MAGIAGSVAEQCPDVSQIVIGGDLALNPSWYMTASISSDSVLGPKSVTLRNPGC